MPWECFWQTKEPELDIQLPQKLVGGLEALIHFDEAQRNHETIKGVLSPTIPPDR